MFFAWFRLLMKYPSLNEWNHKSEISSFARCDMFALRQTWYFSLTRKVILYSFLHSSAGRISLRSNITRPKVEYNSFRRNEYSWKSPAHTRRTFSDYGVQKRWTLITAFITLNSCKIGFDFEIYSDISRLREMWYFAAMPQSDIAPSEQWYYIRSFTRPQDEYHCEAISLDRRSNITRSEGTNIVEKSTLTRAFFWWPVGESNSCYRRERAVS